VWFKDVLYKDVLFEYVWFKDVLYKDVIFENCWYLNYLFSDFKLMCKSVVVDLIWIYNADVVVFKLCHCIA